MTKKSIKSALGATLKAEEDAIKSRFERAEAIIEQKFEKPVPKPQPQPPVIEKVIRDSFTMPSTDYALIGELKKRCLKSGISITKSEILRAGLLALNGLDQTSLTRIVGELAKVKMGRPARSSE
jgi:hypothetical protein